MPTLIIDPHALRANCHALRGPINGVEATPTYWRSLRERQTPKTASDGGLFDRLDDLLGREAEFRKQHFGGRRGTEVIDPDHLSFEAHVAPPVGPYPALSRHAPRYRGGQHALLIRLVLRVEAVGAGHGHQADLTTLGIHSADRVGGDPHLGTGGDDDGLRRSGCLDEHIAAPRDIGHLLGLACLMSTCLAREHQQRRSVPTVQRHAPRHRRFNRIARPPQVHMWDETQTCKMLDGLMCGPILAQSDRIVGINEYHPYAHQAGHSECSSPPARPGSRSPSPCARCRLRASNPPIRPATPATRGRWRSASPARIAEWREICPPIAPRRRTRATIRRIRPADRPPCAVPIRPPAREILLRRR